MGTLTTTRLGIPYPDGAARVMDGDNAMGAIAQTLDSLATAGIPYRIAAGTVSISLSAARFGQTAVTFPVGRFTAQPIIAATPQGSAGYVPCMISTTSAGVTIRVDFMDAGTPTVTIPVPWVAVQMTPAAGPGIVLTEGAVPFTVTCHTEGCENDGHPIELAFDPEFGAPGRVECGVCAQPITDVAAP